MPCCVSHCWLAYTDCKTEAADFEDREGGSWEEDGSWEGGSWEGGSWEEDGSWEDEETQMVEVDMYFYVVY